MTGTLRKVLLLSALFAAPLWFATALWAAELQTDWIQPVPGSGEANLGAKLRAVESAPEEGGTKVTISIPKSAIADREDIQEIVVYGQKEDKSEPKLEIRHEWVADYDKDNYGLVLYLGENGNIPLRLYLKSQD